MNALITKFEREKLEKEKRKRRKKAILIIFGILIAVIAIQVINNAVKDYESRLQVEGEILRRDITNLIAEIPEEPENRERAWDSELPEFIEDDIKYMYSEDIERILYYYGSFVFELYRGKENKTSIKVLEPCFSKELENFSLYNNDGKITLYGENDSSFVKLKWYKD